MTATILCHNLLKTKKNCIHESQIKKTALNAQHEPPLICADEILPEIRFSLHQYIKLTYIHIGNVTNHYFSIYVEYTNNYYIKYVTNYYEWLWWIVNVIIEPSLCSLNTRILTHMHANTRLIQLRKSVYQFEFDERNSSYSKYITKAAYALINHGSLIA